MTFTGVYNSPSRQKETATYPFSIPTYTGNQRAPWAIRSTVNLPTLTSTWTLDPSNIKAILSTLVQRARALCNKKSLHNVLEFLKPLSGKIIIVSNRQDGPSTRRLEPPSRKRSQPRSPFFRVSRQHTAGSAEFWPKTTLNVMACRLVRSPVSSVLWRTTWDWVLRGLTAYPASVVRSTSDKLVDL